MNTRDNILTNSLGHIVIGGADSVGLAEKYGTPLYVFDRAHFENIANGMFGAINKYYGDGEIAYASKAFSCEAIYFLCAKLGLSVDVVSGGELHLALKGNFPAERIYFHGNAKTDEEIDFAVRSSIGTIVLESVDECKKIAAAAARYDKKQGVMVRVNPGVEAHTHSFVQTARTDSKFGVQLDDDDLTALIIKIIKDDNLEFEGLHVHIGSQIFDIKPYILTLEKLVLYIKKLKNIGIQVNKLNMGGGFAITYTADDPVFDGESYEGFVRDISNNLISLCNRENVARPRLVFEPGRSLVGAAGYTIYRVIAVKNIPSVRKYVSVDGGMFDNPRHALYGSRYEASVCAGADEPKTEKVTISGKCCESGDIITSDIMLQPVNIGDFIVIFNTGAYNYTMASNYNGNLIPPVVAVKDGVGEYFIKPQTYEDLARNNAVPDSLKKEYK